jgi:hypothetical protein
VLQHLNIRQRLGRPQQFSPDPDYLVKQATLLDCLRQAASDPNRFVVLFMDEMGFWRWPQGGWEWMPAAPAPHLTVPCAANNRQWRIIGVLNALTGQVNYLDNYIVGRQVVAKMYQVIDQAYPDAERIYLVQDNWSIHQHPDVQTARAAFPRIQPVWLPTYAHWLNPIEKLWRWLRQQVLRLHRWADDWPTLLSHVRAFLDQYSLGSLALLRYVGLLGDGKLARAARSP